MVEWLRLHFRDPAVRICTVSAVTVAVLYAIAAFSKNEIDVATASPSTPRKSLEINKRNDGRDRAFRPGRAGVRPALPRGRGRPLRA
jgi:hypothetical protein